MNVSQFTCLRHPNEEKLKWLPVFGSTVSTLNHLLQVKCFAEEHFLKSPYACREGDSKGMRGICAIQAAAIDTPCSSQCTISTSGFFPFSLPASAALWYAKILIAVLSFSPHSACKRTSHFYLCAVPFGQPTVTQPSENRPDCSSAGAQQAEDGDKDAGFSLAALSNLC